MADDWKSWSGVAQIRHECEAQAAAEGLAGLDLFFRGQQLFQERLEKRPTYRERQAAWKSKQMARVRPVDPLRAALEAIRDGHNDPRALAKEVLSTANIGEG